MKIYGEVSDGIAGTIEGNHRNALKSAGLSY